MTHCGLALYKRQVKIPLARKDAIKLELGVRKVGESNGRGRGGEGKVSSKACQINRLARAYLRASCKKER